MRTEAQNAARRAPEQRAKANAYAKLYRSRIGPHQSVLERNASYYHQHRDEIIRKKKERYASDPEHRLRHKMGNLRWLYGITPEQYQAFSRKQEGMCAICLSPGTDARRAHLCVDHDHVTGRIRGLLCSKCNVALGFLKDDPKIVQRLIKYLET